MEKIKTFEEFFTTQSVQISIWGFIINLLLTALLSFILSFIYTKYGRSLSNRKMFASNFVLLGITTMMIITVVKSSLALSLGLVGALSIVRFRAAIKEPEELSYLFLTIAIGLGFGADQRIITVIGFIFISCLILLKNYTFRLKNNQNMQLTITIKKPQDISLEQIVETIKKYCLTAEMKRFDENDEILEASFLLEFSDFKQLNKIKSALKKLNDSLKISFLDSN